MHCEACGHNQPDPKPVVIEKVKEVQMGDNAFYIRLAFFLLLLLLTIAGGLTLEAIMKQRTIRIAIETPGVKVEQMDYDSTGRPVLKIQR